MRSFVLPSRTHRLDVFYRLYGEWLWKIRNSVYDTRLYFIRRLYRSVIPVPIFFVDARAFNSLQPYVRKRTVLHFIPRYRRTQNNYITHESQNLKFNVIDIEWLYASNDTRLSRRLIFPILCRMLTKYVMDKTNLSVFVLTRVMY